MNNPFQNANSHWAKYSEYLLKEARDGTLYVTPAPKAKPSVYDPLKNPEELVVDALNVGMTAMHRAGEDKIQKAVMEFVAKYGLLGIMPALPTTAHFMDYDTAYLPLNHFIKDEYMDVMKYAMLFYPFQRPGFRKTKNGTSFDVTAGPGDGEILALTLAFAKEPMAMNMSLMREYAERYDWLVTQFKDWAFTFGSSFLYYRYYDSINEDTRNLYRLGMAAFGGSAPTYRVALQGKEKPTIIWYFNSLLISIQTMFGLMLTDDEQRLRCCKHCQYAFAAQHPNSVFCSPRCKNQYNVYKSRAKQQGD